jgi:hypothetical protein
MVCFGAVLVDENLKTTFYGKLKPVSEKFNPEALAVSGFTREETMDFDDPEEVMLKFEEWIKENSKGRPVFISDNNGFDWMFICWYFHHFIGRNPFGFSSRRLTDLYCGLEKILLPSGNIYEKLSTPIIRLMTQKEMQKFCCI